MKFLVTLLFTLLTTLTFGQKPNTIEKPKTDERVEIVSIAFRLAESDEFSAEMFQLYTDRIQAHYKPYKNHELIQFIKKLRSENGVGYDAVMRMAIHLDQDLNPLVKFTDNIPDKRWGKDNAYQFVSLLKQFYKDSNSKKFFKDNQSLYKEASKRFKPVYERLDLSWYKNFYGNEPNEKFVIVNGLGNGGGNYGPSIQYPDGKREVYAIMGAWKTDSSGMVVFPVKSYFPTLLHEFNHSFVNHLIAEDEEPFKSSGEILFSVVKDKMNHGGYTSWQTMLNEALVRAAVIKYMKDHQFPEQDVALEISEQLNRGFIWMEELVKELEYYDKNRKAYATLESYMPVLAKAYETYAENIDALVARNESFKPRFKSISEFTNGAQQVDPTLKQVTINFDKPFSGANFIRPEDSNKAFPDFKSLSFSDDNKSVMLEWNLESDTEYQFILIGLSPESSEEGAAKDYVINFKTE